MSIEIPDTAAVLESDERGVPRRITNLRDVETEAAMPPPLMHIDAPPGFSHGAPAPTVYDTGPGTTPNTGDDHDE